MPSGEQCGLSINQCALSGELPARGLRPQCCVYSHNVSKLLLCVRTMLGARNITWPITYGLMYWQGRWTLDK